jgi:antitoxin (DNA-binding transcriptional repressor) of toxin-antitoxin stability system
MTTFYLMKTVGIREFRDKATHYLASGEILAVKRHGKVVGFYIPVEQSDEKEVQQALTQLSVTVEAALVESGLSEEELSQALLLSRPD